MGMVGVQLPLPGIGADESDEAAALTRRLKPLRQEWTPELLGRECLLTPADLTQIMQCSGSQNKLGFALHLVLLRLLHVALKTLDDVPEPIIHFVALQLTIDPAVLSGYPQREQTRHDHLVRIRRHLGIRAYSAARDDDPLRAYLIQRALHRDDDDILLEEAEEWLRRNRILYPAISTLKRRVSEASTQAETLFSTTIQTQVTAEQRTAILALLDLPHDLRGTLFMWLKEAARVASVKSLKDLLAKHHTIQATRIDRIDLSPLNRNRVRQMADLGRKYYTATMRGFSVDKRLTILVCLLQDLRYQVIDDLLEMVDELVGGTFATAEKARKDLLVKHGKALNLHLRRFRAVAQVLLDPSITDSEVRQAAFAQIPQADLQASVVDSAPLVQPEDYSVFAFVDSHYSHLRAVLTPVFKLIPFTGTATAQPTLEAIAFLTQLDQAKTRWKTLPADTPCAFVPVRWTEAVMRPDGTINHRMWVACLAEQLRNSLRSSDILVPGSHQYRNWRSYLHPDTAWAQRRAGWFADEWHGSPDPRIYLERVETVFEETVTQVAAGWQENTFARLEKGRLVLSKDEKIAIPPSAQALREAITSLMPRIKLPDLLLEVDQWVRLREVFTHPNEPGGSAWAGRTTQLDATIFAAITALGCNLPLTAMADAAEISYHHLIHTADWYVREECIRQAIIRLVDYHHQLPLTAAFGPGTAAMSDGIRFGVAARSLYARHNPKLPVRRRGITLYDMISDQGSQPYIDVIRCDLREAPAALDAALHHQTELPLHEHITDTHGYTDLVFGLFELESRVFSPRIRDLPAQILYPLRPSHKQTTIGQLFRGPYIQPERIIRHWDEMHRIAASLKDGTVTAKLLVSKLHALKRQSGGHKGAQELGRVFKTIAALTYISDESYRRHIHRTLNKGELLHALARDLFFGQQGVFHDLDLEGQLNRATSLSLLINAIIVWNTRYMMKALDHLRATGYPLNEADLAFLTPIRWEHIAFHGTYNFLRSAALLAGDLRPLRTA